MKSKIKYMITSIILLFITLSHVNAEQKSILVEGNGDEYGNYPLLLDDGSFLVVGQYKSTDIVGLENKGDYDGYIVKYDKHGNKLWMNSFGGSDYDDFTSVVETTDKGYLVVGEVCSSDINNITLVGDCDAIVIKYDKNGSVVWQKTYGSQYEDYFTTIQKANDETYIVGGKYKSKGTILKIAENGDIKLEKEITTYPEVFFITTNPNGGYIIGDYTQSSIVRVFDEDFNFKWSTTNSNTNLNYIYVNDAVVDKKGNIIIIGTHANSEGRKAYISKYDANGNLQWEKEYGSIKETFNAIKLDENGNYKVVGGKKVNTDNIQLSEAIIVTYDTEGNILHDESYSHEKGAWFYGMDYVSDEAYVYVGSSFENETSFADDILIVYNTNAYIYNIISKTEGKGSIEVVSNAGAGEKITFNIIPEKGFVLKEVRVTDANGKVVTFTNNTFTMPSADVTIEVIFIEDKKNPETTDVAVIACIAIIVLGGIGTMYSIRKLSWLK